MDFPGGSVVKNPPANAGDTDSIPDPGRYPHTSEQLSHVPQLLGLCSRTAGTEARAPQSPCSATRGAPQHEACSPQLESGTRSLQLEGSLHSSEDTSQPINKIIFKNKKIKSVFIEATGLFFSLCFYVQFLLFSL